MKRGDWIYWKNFPPTPKQQINKKTTDTASTPPTSLDGTEYLKGFKRS